MVNHREGGSEKWSPGKKNGLLYNQVFDVIKIDQISDHILNFQMSTCFVFNFGFVCYCDNMPLME